MNKYLLIDYETNTVLSLNKIDINFKENEIQTGSCTCKDRLDLLETTLKIIQEELEILESENDE